MIPQNKNNLKTEKFNTGIKEKLTFCSNQNTERSILSAISQIDNTPIPNFYNFQKLKLSLYESPEEEPRISSLSLKSPNTKRCLRSRDDLQRIDIGNKFREIMSQYKGELSGIELKLYFDEIFSDVIGGTANLFYPEDESKTKIKSQEQLKTSKVEEIAKKKKRKNKSKAKKAKNKALLKAMELEYPNLPSREEVNDEETKNEKEEDHNPVYSVLIIEDTERSFRESKMQSREPIVLLEESLYWLDSNYEEIQRQEVITEGSTFSENILLSEASMLEKLALKKTECSNSDYEIERMNQRFQNFNKLETKMDHKDSFKEIDELNFEEAIVGKCLILNKPFLRATERPDPETVRPEHILREALKFFCAEYQKDKNYESLVSQLRSIRQDLTIQNIKNSFTVQVYEENLEVSLFERDIIQFKHCQSTLWELYCEGYYYTEESRNKFVAHQMLTLIMEQKNQELQFMLIKSPEACLLTAEVQKCLKYFSYYYRLRKELIVGNYCAFFSFYKGLDKLNKSLIDLYFCKVIMKLLLMICKTGGERVHIKCLKQITGEKYSSILESIIDSEGGIIENGYLALKLSYDRFFMSDHLNNKKVEVLLN